MSYKSINEKYKSIFESGLKEKKEQEEMIVEADVVQQNSKRFSMFKKGALSHMKELEKEIDRWEDKFIKSDKTDMKYYGVMNEIADDIYKILQKLKKEK